MKYSAHELWFDAWDANENGVWDRAELTTMVAAMGERHPPALAVHERREHLGRTQTSG